VIVSLWKVNKEYSIRDFSPHLFWDTRREDLDFERSKAQIIGQVLQYGRMEDWHIVEAVYSKETIKEVVTQMRSMDPVSLSFIAHYLQLDLNNFRCYKPTQSTPDFRNC